jgi:putative ABC transport system substrate-binding protein
VKRRDVLAMLGASMIGAAILARAQKPATPIVGFLCSGSAAAWTSRVGAFRKGLAEAGYTEAKNVTIEFRWADGRYERLAALAADLLRRNVSVLIATGGSLAAMEAKKATSTVPVVFTMGGDPVELGLVASLNRPGGNITGVSIRAVELEPKLMSLLHELVPKATVAGILVNPGNRPLAEAYVRAAQDAARTFGMKLHVLDARSDDEIGAAFAALPKLPAGALVVSPDPFFETRRDGLIALAARYALPTLYFEREFVIAGGLASYGADLADAYRQAGLYAGKILAGAKPADMPIVQSTKIELLLNLKTARTLGLTIPLSLRLRADELIE